MLILLMPVSMGTVGIKNSHGKMVFNPHSHAKIGSGDTLIVPGEPSAIIKPEDLVSRPATVSLIKKHRQEHVPHEQ